MGKITKENLSFVPLIRGLLKSKRFSVYFYNYKFFHEFCFCHLYNSLFYILLIKFIFSIQEVFKRILMVMFTSSFDDASITPIVA